MTEKETVFIELIGEPSTGKTHISSLFSNPFLADLTVRAKSQFVLKKLYPEDWKDRYARLTVYKDLEDALVKAHNDGRKTFIIETGAELRLFLGIEALKLIQKDKPQRQSLGTYEWKKVNEMFKDLVEKCMITYKMNLIITAELKDEWKAKQLTGRRKRDGYPKMNFFADLRLLLKIEKVVTEPNPETVVQKRIAVVAKNGFISQLSDEWVDRIELPEDNDPSEGKTFGIIMKITGIDEERWTR